MTLPTDASFPMRMPADLSSQEDQQNLPALNVKAYLNEIVAESLWARAGLQSITIKGSGGGDSGGIDSIAYAGADDAPLTPLALDYAEMGLLLSGADKLVVDSATRTMNWYDGLGGGFTVMLSHMLPSYEAEGDVAWRINDEESGVHQWNEQDNDIVYDDDELAAQKEGLLAFARHQVAESYWQGDTLILKGIVDWSDIEDQPLPEPHAVISGSADDLLVAWGIIQESMTDLEHFGCELDVDVVIRREGETLTIEHCELGGSYVTHNDNAVSSVPEAEVFSDYLADYPDLLFSNEPVGVLLLPAGFDSVNDEFFKTIHRYIHDTALNIEPGSRVADFNREGFTQAITDLLSAHELEQGLDHRVSEKLS